MKKLISYVLVLACLLVLASCTDSSGSSNPGSAGSSTVVTGGETTEDGRLVNGYADGRIGDVLANAFFSYVVNSASLATEYEGQAAPEGKAYLIAEITVKNVFGEEIPMFSDDFQIQWGEGDEDYGYPIPKSVDAQMDDEYSLATAETVTKTVVYEVPIPEGENEYSISYVEYYDDDVEGNAFFVYFDLSMPA